MILQGILDKLQVIAHDGSAQKDIVISTKNDNKLFSVLDVFKSDDKVVIQIEEIKND